MKSLLGLTFLLLSSIGLAQASQEGMLALGNFSMSSPGIGSSGAVTITGQAKERGIAALQVEAFGKTRVLTTEQLSKLGDVTTNGIQLSYEHGYVGHGGRTIYIVFARGFTSGQTAGTVLALDEEGGIRVRQLELSKKP